jgi:hypothetical protein
LLSGRVRVPSLPSTCRTAPALRSGISVTCCGTGSGLTLVVAEEGQFLVAFVGRHRAAPKSNVLWDYGMCTLMLESWETTDLEFNPSREKSLVALCDPRKSHSFQWNG